MVGRTTQAALGWMGPEYEDIIVTNRTTTAVAVGDFEMLDHFQSDVASTTNTVGASTAGLANIVVPLLAAGGAVVETGIFCVVMQGAADDAKTRVRLRGYVPTLTCSGSVTLATSVIGPETGVETGVILAVGTTSTAAARPHKVVFIPLTGGTATPDGWFDGIHGFGYVLSVTGLT